MSYDRPSNTDPFAPWNSPMTQNDPFAPHNDPMRKNDPFEPWNEPFGSREDLKERDRDYYDRY